MASTQLTLRCHYRYDPLDRLINQIQPDAPVHQRFYCKSRLATEIQGAIQHSIIQHDDLLLAQQQRQDGLLDTTLLATDLQRSVLHTLKANQQRQPHAYSPYGHRPALSGLLSLLGFNGERPDPVTGHYLLGNGYRAFNPVLMRFNSPDSWSPFGSGGLNPYTYCLGNPIKFSDPSGHMPFLSKLFSIFNTTEDSLTNFVPMWGYRSYKNNVTRRLSDPTLQRASSLTTPEYIGLHGTGKKAAENLLKSGVDAKYSQAPAQDPVFFSSPNLEVALEYSRQRAKETINSGEFSFETFGKPNVVEVHVQNFSAMRPGNDYDFRHYRPSRTNPDSMTMEIVIRPHNYKNIEIRTAGTTQNRKKVSPRSLEAPF